MRTVRLVLPALCAVLLSANVAVAEKIAVDEAWPSVGSGSEGPRSGPHVEDLPVVDGGITIPPPRSSFPMIPAFPASLTPTLMLSFAGVDGLPKDGFLHIPPDTHMAVGAGVTTAGRVVMITNSGVQIWNKSGTSLAGPTALDAFLGTPVAPTPSAFDPKVIYDRQSGRFFIVVLEKSPNPADPPTTVSNVHMVVSTSSTPSNLTTDWMFMSGTALTTLSSTLTWFDYPGIGSDRDSVFVTGNMFNAVNAYIGTKIRVFDKGALLAGLYTHVDLDFAGSSFFTVQPAHVSGTTDNGNFYLVNRVGPTQYRLWEIAGAPAAPTLLSNALRTWSAGAQVAAGAPQSGTAITLPTLSSRIMNAVYCAGDILLTLSSDMDGDGSSEVFWANIMTNNGFPNAPTVADSGYLDGSTASAWTFMPSINVNGLHDVVINYTQSSSSQFPDMRYASRTVTTPAGTFDAPLVATTSPGFYDSFSPNNPDRWGDYSATVPDPDDGAFWMANELVQTSGVNSSIWKTFIAKTNLVSTSTTCDGSCVCSAGCNAVTSKTILPPDQGLAFDVFVNVKSTCGTTTVKACQASVHVNAGVNPDISQKCLLLANALAAEPACAAAGYVVTQTCATNQTFEVSDPVCAGSVLNLGISNDVAVFTQEGNGGGIHPIPDYEAELITPSCTDTSVANIGEVTHQVAFAGPASGTQISPSEVAEVECILIPSGAPAATVMEVKTTAGMTAEKIAGAMAKLMHKLLPPEKFSLKGRNIQVSSDVDGDGLPDAFACATNDTGIRFSQNVGPRSLLQSAASRCGFQRPKSGKKFQSALVQAFVSCGNPGGNSPNSTTEGNIPSCKPPETFSAHAGNVANGGWRWDPLKGQGKVLFKATSTCSPQTSPGGLLPCSPSSPLNTGPPPSHDLVVTMSLTGIVDTSGPASGSGALATVTRASLDDRTEGDETVVDFPAAFPFSMVAGSARLRSSADALLNAIGQPGLPPCTSLELVSVRVLDRNGDAFAVAGTYLPAP